MKKIIAVLFCAALCGCTDPRRTQRILKDSGYKNIEITGYRFSCSDDDDLCTGFIATSPSGKRVTGAVGSGLLFKGSTIRLD